MFVYDKESSHDRHCYSSTHSTKYVKGQKYTQQISNVPPPPTSLFLGHIQTQMRTRIQLYIISSRKQLRKTWIEL